MGRMCTERDCDIFRGKLIACDGCERMNERMATGPRMAAPGEVRCPKPSEMP